MTEAELIDTDVVAGNDPFDLVTQIVSAYVSNNSVPVSDLAGLIATVHSAVSGLGSDAKADAVETVVRATPAQIRKSITPDALISFEDGKPYKTLKRHLTIRGLTPEAYRAKHGLPADYPITSAGYSAQRSELARSLGLGQQRRKRTPKEADVAESVSDATKQTTNKASGRPRKVKVPA